jgi:hypothetical protein
MDLWMLARSEKEVWRHGTGAIARTACTTSMVIKKKRVKKETPGAEY